MYTSLFQSLNSLTPAASTQAAGTAAATSSSSSSSSSSSTTPGVDLTNTFLQLLTTQLKNQSPLNPLDPNQFVTQLAQFDSLGELTRIQELMQTLVNDVTPTSPPPSGGSAHGSANSISTSSPNSISH